VSNASEQSRGGNRNRRNTQGKGGDGAQGNNQSKGGQQNQSKPEPIKISEDQLKTRMMVLFNKFVKQQTPSEEENKEEPLF